MKAKGLRGQGNGLLNPLGGEEDLAADVSGVALSEVGTQSRAKAACPGVVAQRRRALIRV